MKDKLDMGYIYVYNDMGLAVLGHPTQLINNCILPDKFNNNYGFSPKNFVYKKSKQIGTIIDTWIIGNDLIYFVKLSEPVKNKEIYHCDFFFNKMFSNFTNNQYILSEIIVEYINVGKQVYTES